MGNYQVLSNRGDPVSADSHMLIYLYPNAHHVDNEAENGVTGALEYLGDQLYNDSLIGYYEININYDHPYLDDNEVKNFRDNFKSWFYDQPEYPDYKGTHLCIGSEMAKGWMTHQKKTAFNYSIPGVMGTELLKEQWQTVAIHEVLHSLILEDAVTHMTEDNEHDLGTVYGNNSVSPLAAGYADSHARHGNCASNYPWLGGYNKNLTNCTFRGVEATVDEVL